MTDRAARIDSALRRLAAGHCSPARVQETGCALCEPRLVALRDLHELLTESIDRALVERWLASEREAAIDPRWVSRSEEVLGRILRGEGPESANLRVNMNQKP